MKVPAPKGYHWMENKGGYKLMKTKGKKFNVHKGASKTADIEVQKT